MDFCCARECRQIREGVKRLPQIIHMTFHVLARTHSFSRPMVLNTVVLEPNSHSFIPTHTRADLVLADLGLIGMRLRAA